MPTRPHIVLRDADREDAAALIALWDECAASGKEESSEAFGHHSMWRTPSVGEGAAALELTLGNPGTRMIVALVDGELVGAVVFTVRTLTPLTLTRTLLVTDLHVLPGLRRRGVASALLSAAANHGEEHNCEVVMASIPAQAREPHRYLTKIGFTQIAVVRAIQASKLRSRLSSKATNSRDTGRLIAVRRTLRRRHRVGPEPSELSEQG